jgi:hypothetical protein
VAGIGLVSVAFPFAWMRAPTLEHPLKYIHRMSATLACDAVMWYINETIKRRFESACGRGFKTSQNG